MICDLGMRMVRVRVQEKEREDGIRLREERMARRESHIERSARKHRWIAWERIVVAVKRIVGRGR